MRSVQLLRYLAALGLTWAGCSEDPGVVNSTCGDVEDCSDGGAGARDVGAIPDVGGATDAAGAPDAGPAGGGVDASVPSDAGLSILAGICGSEPDTLSEFEDCYLRTACGYALRCGLFLDYRDMADCLSANTDVPHGPYTYFRTRLEEAYTAGRVSFRPEAYGRCLSRLADNSTCVGGRLFPPCRERLQGTLGSDEPCFFDEECAPSGSECVRNCPPTQCCEGRCRPGVPLGEPCGVGRTCRPGTHCSSVYGSPVCVTGDLGTPCIRDLDCDVDGWCRDGMCAEDLPTGASCTSITQCAGVDQCVGALLLGHDAECTPVAAEGDSCDFECFGRYWCDRTPSNPIGRCLPLADEGGDCSRSRRCAGSDLVCDLNGQCVRRPGPGESCADGRACESWSVCTSTSVEAEPRCVPVPSCVTAT